MIDILSVCSESTSDTPTLAITLSTLFAVYVLADSLLAASAIVRKSAEADQLT